MPGAFRRVDLVPRYGYQFRGTMLFGTRAYGEMCLKLPPSVDAGVYAFESTAAQNFFENAVYTSEEPFIAFRPNYCWRQEGHVRRHPMFFHMIRTVFPNMVAFQRYYPAGNTNLNDVIQWLCKSDRKTIYILTDYTGAIDAWMTDRTMVPGSYAHYRLLGIGRQEDWHLCRELQFLGYVMGDPELAGRAVL